MQSISPEEAIVRFAKMVAAHLLSALYGCPQFQDGAVHLLACFLIRTIQHSALRVRQLLRLQKRALPNSLHLLFLQPEQTLPIILAHLVAHSQRTHALRRTEDLQTYGAALFSSLQHINSYTPERSYANISYIPAFCTRPHGLPLSHSIHQLFGVPDRANQARMAEAYSQLNRQPPLIEIADEQEDEVVELPQKDRPRHLHAPQGNISPAFAKRITPATRPKQPSEGRNPNRPIDLEGQSYSSCSRSLLLLQRH